MTAGGPWIVRYRSRLRGFLPLYQGGPGLDVNAGVRRPTGSVDRVADARRFASLATARRHAYRCNPLWYGEVLDASGAVVFTTGRRPSAAARAELARWGIDPCAVAS